MVFWILLLLPLTLFSQDFDRMMGKGTPAWEHIQTKEDWERLGFFKTLYEESQHRSLETAAIPKVAHMIWLGSEELPQKAIENLKSWKKFHPDWALKLWMDVDREISIACVQKKFVEDFSFETLGSRYDQAENCGEKSLLLRYEILFREGGIYLDHDCEVLKSLEPLCASHHFFCGLELPSPTFLSSSIFASPHLIGARPRHPILKACMEQIAAHWDRLENCYPGSDPIATRYRALHRSIEPLTLAIEQVAGVQETVLPALLVSSPEKELSAFARHAHAGTWHQAASHVEKKVAAKKETWLHKNDRFFYIALALALLNIAFLFSFFLFLRRRRA